VGGKVGGEQKKEENKEINERSGNEDGLVGSENWMGKPWTPIKFKRYI
jgi:hypothetical protein